MQQKTYIRRKNKLGTLPRSPSLRKRFYSFQLPVYSHSRQKHWQPELTLPHKLQILFHLHLHYQLYCSNSGRSSHLRQGFGGQAVGSVHHSSLVQSSSRGVVQLARMLAWGASGRWFESSRPDHWKHRKHFRKRSNCTRMDEKFIPSESALGYAIPSLTRDEGRTRRGKSSRPDHSTRGSEASDSE